MEKAKKEFAERKKEVYRREDKVLRYGDGKNTVQVKLKTTIPFTKRIEMIGEIVGMVFTGKGDTVESYAPGFTEFAKRYATIAYYTDVKLPSDLDKTWELLNNTAIYKDVVRIVGGELRSIFKEADEAIRTRRDYLVNKTDILGMFHKLLDNLKPLEGVDAKELMETLKKLPKMSIDETVDAILKSKLDGKSELETEAR